MTTTPSVWLQRAKSLDKRLLLSVESVYRHRLGAGFEGRLRYLERLKEALSGFNIRIILIFRRPDDYALSLYKEIVRKNFKILDPLSKWVYMRNFYGIEYFRNACMFRDVFGRVDCLVYEDLVSGDGLFHNFSRYLDIDPSGMIEPGSVRSSLSNLDALIKNYANSWIDSKDRNSEFLKWLRSAKVQDEVLSLASNHRIDIWGDDQARVAFLKSRREDLESLRSVFFPGRVDLFERFDMPARLSDSASTTSDHLPLEIRSLVDRYFLGAGQE